MSSEIYQQLFSFSELRPVIENKSMLNEIISGLITRFEPINFIEFNSRIQHTVGFECLLYHKDHLDFLKIKEMFLSLGISGNEALKILDVVSMLVHFESIRQFDEKHQDDFLANLFFSINITKNVIYAGYELNKSLIKAANILPVANIYLELSEKLEIIEKEKVNKHLLLSSRYQKINYLLDDVYATSNPTYLLDFFSDKKFHGLKYDHERLWKEFDTNVKSSDYVFDKHLDAMYCHRKRMVIIEGVKDESYLDFIFQHGDILGESAIYIQGEFAQADDQFREVLKEFPHPFGYILMKKQISAPQKKVKEATQNAYLNFLNNYGDSPLPQPVEDAAYDSQIKSMSLTIANIIINSDKGTILDIGYGKGVVLKRISELDAFKSQNGWIYLGIDKKESKKELLHLAVDLNISERVKCLSLDNFYKNWILRDEYPSPLLIIIRNVFHELDIKQTAKLVHTLLTKTEDIDTLIIQDLQVFPKSERGHACWQPEFFKKMLDKCGFDNTLVEEPTKRGNRWFTVKAKRNSAQKLFYEEIEDIVIQQRQQQLDQWEKIAVKLIHDQSTPNKHNALVDLDLQKGALSEQLVIALNKKLKSLHNKPKYIQNGKHDKLMIPNTYRSWVIDHCHHMDLRNLMDKGKAIRVELPEFFIPLYADMQDKKEGNSRNKLSDEQRKSVDIEDLVACNDYMIVEGNAGSGKTTLLKHMSYLIMNRSFGHGFDDNNYLPILLFLKDLKDDTVDMFKDKAADTKAAEIILTNYFSSKGLDIKTIISFCKKGKAIFFFDGLDEIEDKLRDLVVSSLADFRTQHSCKMILSGRSHGIDATVIKLFGDRHVNIQDLKTQQVEEFIIKWFEFIYSERIDVGRKTAADLFSDIKAHPNINKLTHNPLMLTAICILYYDNRRLPEQRAELYKKFIDNLIYRRFEDPEKVCELLMTLAFRVHLQGKRGFDRVFAFKIMKEVYPLNNKEANANRRRSIKKKFEDIVQNCGLIRLEYGQYDFCHLTFQEFLAARYIATQKFDYINEIKDFWDKDWYKEFIKLFVGFLSIDCKGWANKIVLEVLNKKDINSFKKWRLAADTLLDIHPSTRDALTIKKAKKCLISILNKSNNPEVLANTGELLGWLGDPRDLNEFVPIQGGEYVLENIDAVMIDPFEIGKYPVTNQWYVKFIKDDGYKNKEFWSKEGRKWLEYSKTSHPQHWHIRKWKCPNSPVVGLCWYEADAFCKWLSSKDNEYLYRLPTEEEWQVAAVGNNSREYPWGNWRENSCNCKMTKINKSSSVGIFLNGNTPEGIGDLIGNVWEWTCSDYKLRKELKDFIFDPQNTNDYPVLRGGSWAVAPIPAKGSDRLRYIPEDRDSDVGFRCLRTKK